MTTPLLRLRHLTKHFREAGTLLRREAAPVKAIDGVSLDIGRGEIFALVGESGCGKSTLGRLVLRLLEPTTGEMVFDGQTIDLASSVPADYRKTVQIVFQDSRASLNPRRTVYQILRDPMLLHGVATPKTARAAAAALLERVGLAPAERFLDRYPRQFSGGQLQRIGIARALSLKPKLIVADEPVSALDALVRAQILDLIMSLRKEDRLAILFITHDLAVVRAIADRVAVMYLGRIVESGPVDAIFAKASHPYTRALLSATPIPDPRRAASRQRIEVRGEVPDPGALPSGCRFHPRCPSALPICSTVDPSMTELTAEVQVACHLYD
ncbi:MAG: ABC transporter ATP-binding protein [Hyphomicrobiales bacterium]